MVVGARHTSLSVSRTATLLGFSHSCMKNGPPPKRHPANLTQLWELCVFVCVTMVPRLLINRDKAWDARTSQIPRDRSQYSTSIHVWGRWDNSKRSYLQEGFCFGRLLWTGVVDGCQHLPLTQKVASLNPAIESCFVYFCFKPIPNLNPYHNHSELMPKCNLKHVEMWHLELLWYVTFWITLKCVFWDTWMNM